MFVFALVLLFVEVFVLVELFVLVEVFVFVFALVFVFVELFVLVEVFVLLLVAVVVVVLVVSVVLASQYWVPAVHVPVAWACNVPVVVINPIKANADKILIFIFSPLGYCAFVGSLRCVCVVL